LLISSIANAQQIQSLSITLENVDYPFPVRFLPLNIEGQDVRMAYMDIKPDNPNGKTLNAFSREKFWRVLLDKCN
jgi:hypothetical protein